MNLNTPTIKPGPLTAADFKPAWPYEPQTLTDEQIEAASAAIDFDDDTRPIPGAGPIVWLAVGAVLFASAVGVFLIVSGA